MAGRTTCSFATATSAESILGSFSTRQTLPACGTAITSPTRNCGCPDMTSTVSTPNHPAAANPTTAVSCHFERQRREVAGRDRTSHAHHSLLNSDASDRWLRRKLHLGQE